MSRWTARRWLRDFHSVGGMALPVAGTQVLLGYHVKGYAVAQHDEARCMLERMEAVKLRYDAIRLQLAFENASNARGGGAA